MSETLGKYTLVRKLATGGMAEVFLARADGPRGFKKKCVVKRVLPHFSDDVRFTEMFLSEAQLAAQLNHPNLVQIFDFGEDRGRYYLAMEYIDGPNLRVLNQAARHQGSPIGFALAARIIALAAEGLHFAHELRDEHGNFLNLVHRDISPDNVLVSRNGAVKVVDFGIAKAASQPHLTRTGMIKGKIAYMPPEQLSRVPLDRRADLFALGIVLYELITGGMPFDATSEVSIIQAIMSTVPLESPTVFRPECPPALEAIVTRCLEKDREQRYATAAELQNDLERFIQSTGEVVGTRDVAALVARLFEGDEDRTSPEVPLDAAEGLGATHPSQPSQERVGAPASVAALEAAGAGAGSSGGSGMSNTALRPVTNIEGLRPRRWPVVVGVLGAAVLAFGAWFMLSTVPPPREVSPPVAVTPAEPVRPVAPAPVVPAEAQPPDAGLEAALDAGAPAEPPAPVEAPPAASPKAVPARQARLELRIRPFATVYLDGRLLGTTPLEPLPVTAGKHKLRLVNEDLGKDVVLTVTFTPGLNVVKHNLKE